MDGFEALADPIRREILLLVRDQARTAGWLAERFPISRPAVSRHLRVLRESGLIHDQLQGRERFYRLAPTALRPVAEYLDDLAAPQLGGLAAALQSGIDALETEVHRARRHRPADRRPQDGSEPGPTDYPTIISSPDNPITTPSPHRNSGRRGTA